MIPNTAAADFTAPVLSAPPLRCEKSAWIPPADVRTSSESTKDSRKTNKWLFYGYLSSAAHLYVTATAKRGNNTDPQQWKQKETPVRNVIRAPGLNSAFSLRLQSQGYDFSGEVCKCDRFLILGKWDWICIDIRQFVIDQQALETTTWETIRRLRKERRLENLLHVIRLQHLWLK